MFAAFDTNHDGTISFNEFLMLVVFKTPGDIDSRLAYVFDLFVSKIIRIVYFEFWIHFCRCDLSGDGKISIQEMAKYIHAAVRKCSFWKEKNFFFLFVKLTLAGDTELDPIVAAAGAFTILGINKKKSLNKKQFIKGYMNYRNFFCFSRFFLCFTGVKKTLVFVNCLEVKNKLTFFSF